MARRILPLRPELRRNYEVVIVGGGIHGLSVAYNLARAGRRNIAVFERSYLGAGASGRNLTLIRNSWANPAWAGLIWRSSQLFRGLSTELGYNIMFTERGSYLCFREPRRADVAKTAVPMQNALGIPTQIVSADDL
ncbi:MAG: sarcosine oxidase, subunit beta, partial [Gaiellaceae bacterium]|nr:sarcosine oxidase, subunit beta [Gaiellaceae bacterium]